MHAWTDPVMCVRAPPLPPQHALGKRTDGAKSVNSYPALLGYTFLYQLYGHS